MAANEESMGLAAFGTSGDWQVEIDQSIDGPEVWQLQIEGRVLLINCGISGADVVVQLLGFLDRQTNGSASDRFRIASDTEILRDDEFGDRFFIHVTGKEGTTVRACLVSEDVQHLRQAIAQAKAELVRDQVLS